MNSNQASEYQSAQNAGDYRIMTKSVTFGPTDTLSSGTVSKNLTITINDDDLVEEDQKIPISIKTSASTSLGRHYALNGQSRVAVVTIEDDEADEAKIAFHASSAASRAELAVSATETDADITVSVPVTITAKPESQITVPISVVSAGTTATSADYTIATSSVTFRPGDSGLTQNLTVTVRGDELVEEDQTIKLRIGSISSGLGRLYARDTAQTSDTDGISTEATVTISDDERPAAKIAFGSNAAGTSTYTPAAVDEDDGTINVPITITDRPESTTHFTVEVLAASTATEWTNAQNPGDYRVLNTSKRVTFGPSTSINKTQNVRIQLQNNALVEHPETVQLRIVAADMTPNDLGDHYDRHAQSKLATLTINDDDAAAAKIAIGTNAASMTKFTRSVDEDVTNGTYKIPIKVSHSPSVDTTFEIEVLTGGAAGTATGDDYSIGTKTFTITPTAKQRHGGRDDHQRPVGGGRPDHRGADQGGGHVGDHPGEVLHAARQRLAGHDHHRGRRAAGGEDRLRDGGADDALHGQRRGGGGDAERAHRHQPPARVEHDLHRRGAVHEHGAGDGRPDQRDGEPQGLRDRHQDGDVHARPWPSR